MLCEDVTLPSDRLGGVELLFVVGPHLGRVEVEERAAALEMLDEHAAKATARLQSFDPTSL